MIAYTENGSLGDLADSSAKLIEEVEEALYTFPANAGEDQKYMILSIIVFLAALGLVFLSGRKQWRFAQLLFGFVAFIALGTGIFSFLTAERLQPVNLYKDSISVPRGNILFKDILKIQVEELKEHSKYPIQKDGQLYVIGQTDLMVIEKRDGSSYLLSEENYPLDSIYAKLEILVEDWREEKK